ncbi:hypothetical protein GGS20DRAFT_553167 [Poronia punctata]|nr:hypothetical protein GGS20DRAFT_553167 [Poronia punctata]
MMGMPHLRFRRAPSNPTSPVTDRNSWDPAALRPTQLVPEDGITPPDIRPRSSNAAPYPSSHAHGQPSQSLPSPHSQLDEKPPVLPPITRVVSDDQGLSASLEDLDLGITRHEHANPHEDSKRLSRSPVKEQSGFMGGVALQNYWRGQASPSQAAPQGGFTSTMASSMSGTTLVPSSSSSKPPPPVKSASSSFVSPTDLQHAPPLGKRPAGSRLTSEPVASSNPPTIQEPSKTKKGLPFLKNPVSTLLLRRRGGQAAPEVPLPLHNQPEKVYDPRIRGTRVHDFSAPRPRKTVVQTTSSTNNETLDTGNGPISQYQTSPTSAQAPPVPPKDDHPKSNRTSFNPKGHLVEAMAGQAPREGSTGVQFVATEERQDSRRRKGSTALSKIDMSRNASRASGKSALSSIPRHMKSTSSRFSFDMIGAEEQEKVLEERHRQRQQERMLNDSTTNRDSRFDELDEDAFDYDAMDYDDDLEERIPGVNADYDEEDEFEGVNDPDNDQDNFAGFTFQRSDPTSSLTTPHSAGAAPTPRDHDGQMVGYAETEGTPDLDRRLGNLIDDLTRHSPNYPYPDNAPAGLGIQGLEPAPETSVTDAPNPPAGADVDSKPLGKDDELYFDDGLNHDFSGEGDGSTFDESIFDMNDTDQYGRPIPGLFANALAERNTGLQTKKRESDMTSRLSAHSILSQSTGHTSLSADMRQQPVDGVDEAYNLHMPQPRKILQQIIPKPQTSPEVDYQAALAAAAHKAAASGKFRRDSSPPPPTEFPITSPVKTGAPHADSHSHSESIYDDLADYEYDDAFTTAVDDDDMDDDAIIAEANASALANDYDGWYGQEFGFFPAPNHVSNSRSENNTYQYANGGFFGPSGLGRTTSGRVVSREPNLTPITERSEYSNRNSVMSMGWPAGFNGAGPAIQSPGLAQLTMLADDHDMSLSSLLKLRNRAWGGSQASLTSSRDSSPYDRNGAASPAGQEVMGMGMGMSMASGRKNSAFSIYSQESTAPDSEADSPTITMSLPNTTSNSNPSVNLSSSPKANSAVHMGSGPVFSPFLGAVSLPPLSGFGEPMFPEPMSKPAPAMTPTVGVPSRQRPGMGHKHRGSAGSISYIKEEEGGETRWVLERRRTDDMGGIEVLEREVVGGGRI